MLLNDLKSYMNIYSNNYLSNLAAKFNLKNNDFLKYLRIFQNNEQISFKYNEMTDVLELSNFVDSYENRKSDLLKLYSDIVNIDNQGHIDESMNHNRYENVNVNTYDYDDEEYDR